MSKILVVEDDSATRLLLKRDLQLEGYEVTVAKNGEEGLEQAVKIRPALILCDWMMPLMDGVEVCRRVKATPELTSTFFILLTARDSIADRVLGLDAGADDFVSKPIEPNELLARVRAGLRVYQYQQQLSEANQQLSQTLQDLQQTQAQLVQSEKMSSLGQMVAGIAHAINNPITFISGNLDYTKNSFNDLLELIHLYQKYYPQPEQEINLAIENMDWEFLKTDIPKSLDSMKVGASRIRDLVVSLKSFSRLDEAEIKQVDIHADIDNALLLLEHRLSGETSDNIYADDRSKIKVIKEYGILPLVECYTAELNQVFFNLITNAIDAIEELTISETSLILGKGQISIRTKLLDENWVEIAISDNGAGMTPEVVQQIFNPFFTTKPVDKGTGLGLAIAYSIVVDKHKGLLECRSSKGEGTEFLIKIPTRQQL
ncbi:hybrid sensor histidine kinase/response regulator [Planktothrix sp. FACHB-1355]|uniref:histidine kinase n=1 Tax=Aerosakkonema funiforme FACHB-1375 TaxID=2949571 RepID=A0A926ZF98_9CYAN|nr:MULTISPECIES: response regulator [Oscillatoriales]MBD2180474.1 hybrid sensor histidine kinase/response regulator [Aerosakkonema funiforme FACHB-1375]MBD3560306.1 hybrid sensor histidine kinase/response regulator [Planktothrix sp. FACHB-1355]